MPPHTANPAVVVDSARGAWWWDVRRRRRLGDVARDAVCAQRVDRRLLTCTLVRVVAARVCAPRSDHRC